MKETRGERLRFCNETKVNFHLFHESSAVRFTKLQGAGNDYVYVDCFNQPMPRDPNMLAQKIADRHFGVGGDGLILICPSERGQRADAACIMPTGANRNVRQRCALRSEVRV